MDGILRWSNFFFFFEVDVVLVKKWLYTGWVCNDCSGGPEEMVDTI